MTPKRKPLKFLESDLAALKEKMKEVSGLYSGDLILEVLGLIHSLELVPVNEIFKSFQRTTFKETAKELSKDIHYQYDDKGLRFLKKGLKF